MNELTIDRYRQTLDEMRAAIATRQRREQELAAFAEAGDDPSLDDLDSALSVLDARHREAIAAIDERFAVGRRSIELPCEDASTAAQAEYARTSSEIQQRIAEQSAQVEQEFLENRWMLSSLLDDDSENSPRWQYESAKTQLEQARDRLAERWNELKTRYDQSVALVEQRRQRIAAATATPTAPRNRKDALDGLNAAHDVVHQQSAQLQKQILPRLLTGWSATLAALLIWGTTFATVYLLVDPQTVGPRGVSPVVHVLIAGAGGLVAAVLILLIARSIASRQTDRAFIPLQDAMAAAHNHYQHWLRFAKEELQRREAEYHQRYDSVVKRRDASQKQFETDREQRLAELAARRDRELHEAARRRDETLQAASQRLRGEILSLEAAHQQETASQNVLYEQERNRLTEEQAQRIAERETRLRERWNEMTGDWTANVQRLAEFTRAAVHRNEVISADWSAIEDPNWTPPEQIPAGIRIGDYQIDLRRLVGGMPPDPRLAPGQLEYRLPAVLPFPAHPSLVLETSDDGRAHAVELLRVAMLRFLTLLPPGKLRFTVLDPLGLGEKFSAFMHLADFDELLISGRIWTDAGQIEKQTGDLTEHMESVFQKYLRNEFATIEEYNEHAGEVAEPYRILVIANFPAGFSERSARRLASIVTSGSRCGVYTLISIDRKLPMPHGFDPADLAAGATVLNGQDSGFTTAALGPDPIPMQPDEPPSPPLFNAIVRRIGELSKDVRRVEVAFRRIAPGEGDLWKADSRRGIDCPLGRAGATRLQHLKLGAGTSQHVLVAGKTGSGKSTLLHALITNLALRYSPDEIEFYLIDFKKGVEFKTYATHRLPHVKVIAIESDREFGTSTLERLDAVLRERGDLFREAGVQDVAAFRNARPGAHMPRILLIVDEFQEFFTEDDRYSQAASLLLDRLVRQGRAFGIHVLLGSQTLGGAYSLARTTIGQMAVRIALQCGEADAHLILSEENAAARLLTRPGEALYNDANGMVEGNSPFQVAWLGDDERDEYLQKIEELAESRGLPASMPIVFEGNVPADPSRNDRFVRRIESFDELTDEPISAATSDGIVPSAWIGEAVAITGPAEVTFPRQSGANLLVVGQDRGAATGILAACLVGLAAQRRQAPADDEGFATFSVMTPTAEQPDRSSDWQNVLDTVPLMVKLVTADGAAAAIAELAAEVERRQQDPTRGAPLFLLIDDLSRLRDLRRGDDDFGFGSFDREKVVSPAQHFSSVLRDGPGVGVHAIVWCDSYNNVDRWLGRSLLREFEIRVAFQMSGTDSSNLIDSPAASRLGAHRALLHLEGRGTTEKFRPYGPPADEWLAWVRDHLQPDQRSEEDELNIDDWVIS